uniref:Protein yippee-like n=1 Tax=Naja naja TaxID=35670 RepID=A0A8C6XAY7_NAJNA
GKPAERRRERGEERERERKGGGDTFVSQPGFVNKRKSRLPAGALRGGLRVCRRGDSPPQKPHRGTIRRGLLFGQSFQGSQGRAYLFNSVVNVGCGPAEERVLLTGLHAVADIYCENCKTTLGWKYEQAFETSQKYKEGKFIIELNHMIKDNGWD